VPKAWQPQESKTKKSNGKMTGKNKKAVSNQQSADD
jgi:hypothetical protein